MSFQPVERMEDMILDKQFKILLKGLNRNARLEEKRQIVNHSMLPVHKYRLLHRFLSDEEDLSLKLRLNCLRIFLDERTIFFDFLQITHHHSAIKSILKIIAKNCPNIETIDLRMLPIIRENKKNFKNLLKKSKHLKSLRVRCYQYNGCPINQLLLQEDFHLLHRDVQNGLQKIEYIFPIDLTPSECTKLLKLLPNLKSFGMYHEIGPLLSFYIANNDDLNRFMNITEFCDHNTTTTTLDLFVRYCPNITGIFLLWPERNVIEQLSTFPLLSDLRIESDFFDEVMNLIKIIGRQIKKLHLLTRNNNYDPNILKELCPKLEILVINFEKFKLY